MRSTRWSMRIDDRVCISLRSFHDDGCDRAGVGVGPSRVAAPGRWLDARCGDDPDDSVDRQTLFRRRGAQGSILAGVVRDRLSRPTPELCDRLSNEGRLAPSLGGAVTDTRTETDSHRRRSRFPPPPIGARRRSDRSRISRSATERMPIAIVHALALVKQAAARVNRAHGLARRDRRRDRGGRGRGRRGQARRPVPARHLADRQRHPVEHERQRGDRRPRQRDADGHARRQGAGPPQRSRQHEPVVERQLPDRAARRRGAGGDASGCCRRSSGWTTRCSPRPRRGTTSSRSAARICRMRRR